MNWKWTRVTRANPCPVCDKTHWCSVCPELKLVHCMRVESSRPSRNAMGGFIHSFGTPMQTFERARPTEKFPSIDAEKILTEFSKDTFETELSDYAKSLGVTVESLKSIGCQRAKIYSAWAFPMFDGFGRAVGIRLRKDSGEKFAVKGSRQGIFLPSVEPCKTAYICEGVTDTAALLSMGLYGFGRPQCCGSISIITATISRLGIREAIIVADNDGAGIKGAEDLSKELDIPNQIFIPPTKDVRQFLNFGGTAELIRETIKDLLWRQPSKRITT